MAGAAQKLANDLADIRRRLIAVERGSQLSHSTITGPDGSPVRITDGVRTGITAGAQAAAAIDAAANAQAKADGAVVSFFGDDVPEGANEGDLWRKSDGEVLQYVDGEWTAITDPTLRSDVNDALDRLESTEGALDGKISTHFAPLTSPPAAGAVGDLWIVEGTNMLRRWTGTEWVDARDTGIETALTESGEAKAEAATAAEKATSAAAAAQAAEADAATATQKAADAYASAEAAESSASSATGAAATAEAAADASAADAAAALTRAQNAEGDASAAQTAANQAQTAADNAATEAATAGTAAASADAAAAQAAADAAQAVADAAKAAEEAAAAATAASNSAGSADAAATSASNAQTAADTAKEEATAAQAAADAALEQARDSNLLINGDFEGTAGFEPAYRAKLADPHSGEYAAQITADRWRTIYWNDVSVRPGQVLEVRLWSRSYGDIGSVSVGPALDLYRADGTDTGRDSYGSAVTRTLTTGWTESIWRFAAIDADVAKVTLRTSVSGSTYGTGQVLIDDVLLWDASALVAAEAATADAETAQNRADAAHTLAGEAEETATTALSTAGAAQETADGRPLLLFDTTAPAGSAPQGSTWFQVNSAGQVVGQWQQTAAGSGSTWTVREIRSEVIANLDVGKLVAGSATIDSAVANKIISEVIEAEIITGPTIRTAASGARVQLDETGVTAWDSTGSEHFRVSADGVAMTGVMQFEGTTHPLYNNAEPLTTYVGNVTVETLATGEETKVPGIEWQLADPTRMMTNPSVTSYGGTGIDITSGVNGNNEHASVRLLDGDVDVTASSSAAVIAQKGTVRLDGTAGTEIANGLTVDGPVTVNGERIDKTQRYLLTYANGWSDFAGAGQGYARVKTAETAPGTITISGMPKPGTRTNGVTIGYVVPAHRPTASCYLPGTCYDSVNGPAAVMIVIGTDGAVKVYGDLSDTSYLNIGTTYFLYAD